jgi:methyltransferase family protein
VNAVATLRERVLARWHRRDLVFLARHFGTDKWGRHWYAPHYQRHLAPFRTRPITLLEIGVGGYDDPRAGGQSLRMWKAYFPKARVFGLDLYDKSALQEERIRIFQGSQDDPAVIERLLAETGPLDVVIDDGSHLNAHVLRTFELLFPHLRDGGIYAVEDLQTAYWPKFGGSHDPDAPHTSMALLKRLVDGLNHAERIGYAPTFLDRNVRAAHFYHNLAFVERGPNDEESNVLRANVAPDWIVE